MMLPKDYQIDDVVPVSIGHHCHNCMSGNKPVVTARVYYEDKDYHGRTTKTGLCSLCEECLKREQKIAIFLVSKLGGE